jgi:flagellum-specific peptidoglycan hydrolase FlgJ
MKDFFKRLGAWFWNEIKQYAGRVFLFTIFFIGFTVATLAVAQVISDKHKDVYHQYTSYEVYQEESRLRYDSLLLELSNEIDAYISKVSNGASSLSGIVVATQCIEHDIDICFVLAQGEQESHFGTQGVARKTNSVFNVFAFDGHSYNKINANGKYNHPNDCVEPYLKLLKRDYLVDGKTEFDMLHNYVNKNGARYASAESYEDSLCNKMNKIKSETRIDALCGAIKKQRLIIGL